MESSYATVKTTVDSKTPQHEVLFEVNKTLTASLEKRTREAEIELARLKRAFIEAPNGCYRRRYFRTNIAGVLDNLRAGAAKPLMMKAAMSFDFDSVVELSLDSLPLRVQAAIDESCTVRADDKRPPPFPGLCVMKSWIADSSLARPRRAFFISVDKKERSVICLLFERDQIFCSCGEHLVEKIPCAHHLKLMLMGFVAIPFASCFSSRFWRPGFEAMTPEEQANVFLCRNDFDGPKYTVDSSLTKSYGFVMEELKKVGKESWIIGSGPVWLPKPLRGSKKPQVRREKDGITPTPSQATPVPFAQMSRVQLKNECRARRLVHSNRKKGQLLVALMEYESNKKQRNAPSNFF